MPYYTLQQSRINGRYEGQRFLCVQANSLAEAEERAEWFGIDLREINPETDGRRWSWIVGSTDTLRPDYDGYRFAPGFPFAGRWVILFRNGNLQTSDADAFRVPTTIFDEEPIRIRATIEL